MRRLSSFAAATLSLIAISGGVRGQPATTPAKAVAAASNPSWLDRRLKPLPFKQIGPFVALADSSVLYVRDDVAFATRDDEKTWASRPLFGDRKIKARPEQGLVRTKNGTIVLVFLDDLDKRWKWDAKANTHDGSIESCVVELRGKRIAYPYVFERRPGKLWVTSMQGDLCAGLNEADFVKGT